MGEEVSGVKLFNAPTIPQINFAGVSAQTLIQIYPVFPACPERSRRGIKIFGRPEFASRCLDNLTSTGLRQNTPKPRDTPQTSTASSLAPETTASTSSSQTPAEEKCTRHPAAAHTPQ